MDIKLIQEYVKRDISVMDKIKKIMDYRNLRTEQAYYAKLSYEYDYANFSEQSKEVRNAGDFDRSYWKSKLQSLDRDRRGKHNDALISFYGIQSIGRKFGLELLYNGQELSPKDIINYNHPELREQITNAMFEMLHSIEESVIDKEGQENEKELLVKLKQDINKFNKDYNVKKSILKDDSNERDGGIEFDLSKIDFLNNND